MNIPQENYYRKRLAVIEEIGVQWAEQARKVCPLPFTPLSSNRSLAVANRFIIFYIQVARDSGALPLHKVFELIAEGETLPVLVEELKVVNVIYLNIGAQVVENVPNLLSPNFLSLPMPHCILPTPVTIPLKS